MKYAGKAMGWVFLMVAAAAAQEGRKGCDEGCSEARRSGNGWELYNRGVKWERSLDEAMARAKKEGKLLFYYQVSGNLDDAGC